MVVLGFTVTFVCRRQVPNTFGSHTVLPSVVSSFGHVDVGQRPALRRRVESVLACMPEWSTGKTLNCQALKSLAEACGQTSFSAFGSRPSGNRKRQLLREAKLSAAARKAMETIPPLTPASPDLHSQRRRTSGWKSTLKLAAVHPNTMSLAEDMHCATCFAESSF